MIAATGLSLSESRAMATRLAAESAVARGRMLARADEVEKAITKHGDTGGHWGRMVTILRTAGTTEASA